MWGWGGSCWGEVGHAGWGGSYKGGVGDARVGWVIQGWGWLQRMWCVSCLSGVVWGWTGACRGGVEWVMQGYDQVGHTEVGWGES